MGLLDDLKPWICQDTLNQFDAVRPPLPAAVEHLAVDGAYAKHSFVSGAMDLKLHVISKLRRDANLQFLYTGAQKRRGRPRKHAGKVDIPRLEPIQVCRNDTA